MGRAAGGTVEGKKQGCWGVCQGKSKVSLLTLWVIVLF